jgi:[ribosomal protein S5]-alanine N-acetyltransferase
MMSAPQIETARLRFRPLTLDDLDRIHAIWNDAGVRKYLWDDKPVPKETARAALVESIESFDAHGFGLWGLTAKEGNGLIGFCGFRVFGEPQKVEILYGLLPEYWNRGLASEAALAALSYGFDEIGLTHIYAGADPPNAASFRVMEKTGMMFFERMTINNLEAIYYRIAREDFHLPEA